jgi:hypothetical protein
MVAEVVSYRDALRVGRDFRQRLSSSITWHMMSSQRSWTEYEKGRDRIGKTSHLGEDSSLALVSRVAYWLN